MSIADGGEHETVAENGSVESSSGDLAMAGDAELECGDQVILARVYGQCAVFKNESFNLNSNF